VKTLRLGILGTGNIARQVVASAGLADRVKVTSVGSRSPESAQQFVHAHEAVTRGASATDYEGVLADPTVDAVYISLPNSLHLEWTLKALAAGKHVLCEKPIAPTQREAAAMFAAAEAAGTLLVEAFMYRSHPQTHAVTAAVARGDIGLIKHIRTSFCYLTRKVAGNVRFDPSLAGGALLDIGCYCIDLTCLVAGDAPESVSAYAIRHPSGVDEQVSAALRFAGGVTATFTCGMTLQADNTATISGDGGYIEVPVPWKPPTPTQWILAHSTPPKMDSAASAAGSAPPRQSFTIDEPKPLYALELDDFARAVFREIPPAMPKAHTLRNLGVIDAIRSQIA
jgi:D-xylose 1-dehydrogenase (NADP+, D-xylono-1,5-lactone-forming)